MNIDIDELLAYFIETNYTDEQKRVLYTSISLFKMFSLNYYDKEIIDILANNDYYDPNDLKDIIYEKIKDNINFILRDHSIRIDIESSPTLEELNDIANFLFIIQNIENYDLVSYRLFSEDENKNILIDLISLYSLLPKERLHDIIEDVDDNFINGLRAFVEQRIEDTKEFVNVNYKKNFDYFLEFIDNYNCIGKYLYEKGYLDLSIDELFNLSDIDIFNLINENIDIKPEESSLNILSLLLLGKDSYENSLIYFNKNIDKFLLNKTKAFLIEDIMKKILVDFNTYANERKKNFVPIENHEKGES